MTCTRGVRVILLTLSAWFGPQLEVPLGRRPRCRGGDCCPTVVSFVTGTPLSQAWLLMLLLVMPDTAAVALVTVLHERHQQANRNITWRAWPKHRQSRWPRYHGYHSMATIGGPGPSTGSHGGATACHGYYWRSRRRRRHWLRCHGHCHSVHVHVPCMLDRTPYHCSSLFSKCCRHDGHAASGARTGLQSCYASPSRRRVQRHECSPRFVSTASAVIVEPGSLYEHAPSATQSSGVAMDTAT